MELTSAIEFGMAFMISGIACALVAVPIIVIFLIWSKK